MIKSIEKITEFLDESFHNSNGILVGCNTSNSFNSYDCCESDIIIIHDKKDQNIKLKLDIIYTQVADLRLKVFFFNKKSFFENTKVNYLKYVNLDKSFKNTFHNYYGERNGYNIKNFPVINKRDVIRNALQITKTINELNKSNSNLDLCSYYLKITEFQTLELLIKALLKECPSPSHLKYQINMIKEKETKSKDKVDLLLEYLGIEAANISILSRSEKSLQFLFRHCIQKTGFKRFLDKLSFFSKKSMYVDGYLLSISYIKDQNLDNGFIRNYIKILKYSIDVQNKEKIAMLKEADILFNINKNLIKNDY